MRNKTIRAILAVSIILLLFGCSPAPAARDVRSSTAQKSVESTLVEATESGRIVDVYDEYVRLGQGKTKDNWLIIKNVKDAGDTFSIQPCSGCTFEKDTVDISLGKYSIIKFTVSAEEGQKEIRVKDSHGNAYGFATISVIIE